MRVLIVGGSGYIGRRIAEGLLDRGDDVSIVSRGTLHPSVLSRSTHILLDRQDRVAFEGAFRNQTYDVVIDNIAYTRDDVESAVRAFDGRIGQYILTSTMAVYKDTEGPRPLRESDADLTWIPRPGEATRSALHPTQGHAYGNGKRQAELVLSQQQSWPWTVLRPPIVVAADDRTRRVWWFVQRLLDGGPILIPDWGPRRIFQVVFADDLAKAYVVASGNDRALGKAYNVAQPEIFGAETWIEALANALGRTSTSVRVTEDAIAVHLPSYEMPIAGRPFGNYLVELCAAYRDLDFAPSSLDQWVAATAQGCAANPPAADSNGYDKRVAELELAQRVLAAQQHVLESLAAGD